MTGKKFSLPHFFSWLFLAGVFFFLSVSSSFAASYFVDATGGNDSSSGTSEAQAWQTINKINTSSFLPGDTIYLKYGETWQESLTLPSSGSSGNVITLTAYGDSGLDKPTLTGLDTLTGWDLDSGSIYKVTNTYNGSGLTQLYEDGVRLIRRTSLGAVTAGSYYFDAAADTLYVQTTNSADPDTHTMEFTQRPWGVSANGQAYWHIQNLEVSSFALSGFNFRDLAGADHLTVSDSIANWNTVRGYDLGSDFAKDTIHIIDSVTHDNIGEGYWAGNATNSGCDGCTGYNNGKDNSSKGYTDVILAGANFTISDGCADCYIRNSHSYNGYGGTDTFDIEYEGGTRALRTVIENNVIEMSQTNTDNARDAGQDSVWKNNIFKGNPNNVLLRIWADADNISVFHNTFDQSGPGKACIYVPQATNVSIKNNVFYPTNGSYSMLVDTAGTTGFESDYNDLVSSGGNWEDNFYATLAAWQTASGQDANSIAANPLFVDFAGGDYHLTASSPVINQGTDVSILVDKDDNARPQQAEPDMGAYEYLASPAVPSVLTQYLSNGTTQLATGGSTSEVTVILRFTMEATPNTQDTLVPEVEVRPLNTSFSNTVTHTGSGVSYTGTSVTGQVTITGLTVGTPYHWQARITNNAGSSSWMSNLGNPDFNVITLSSSSGSGESSSSSSNSNSGGCFDYSPAGQPDLFQINRSTNTAKLFFTPVMGNTNTYHVVFGLTEGDERYGGISQNVTQESNNGVQSMMIGQLDPRKEYWFKVIPVNGCATGTWSNWLKAGRLRNRTSIFYRYLPSLLRRS